MSRPENKLNPGLITPELKVREKDWIEGAQNFAKFWSCLDENERLGIRYENPSGLGALQALFLAEIPAVIENELAQKYKRVLEKYSLRFIGNFAYSPVAVTRVVEDNRDFFGDKTPEEILKKFSDWADRTDLVKNATYHKSLGLLLGYPLSSIEKFIKVNDYALEIYKFLQSHGPKLGLVSNWRQNEYDSSEIDKVLKFFEDNWPKKKFRKMFSNLSALSTEEMLKYVSLYMHRHRINIHGYVWVDYGGSDQDSLIKQRELEQAYQKSQILNTARIWDDVNNF